jgi:oligopeptidase B
MQDVLAYEEKDNRFYLSLHRTRSKKYICIESDLNRVSTEWRLLKASEPAGQFKVFQPRQDNFEYSVEHANNRFYVYTNWEAPNYRIMEAAESKTAKENWKELIPHRADTYISDFNVFNNFLVLTEDKDALTKFHVISHTGKKDYHISFDEPAWSVTIDDNSDFANNVLRYQFASLVTPPAVYDYNLDTQQKQLKKETEVLGGYKKENYVTERVWATARDGVKVPMSVVYKKGLKKNGNNPLLLYGYGSYGYSFFPDFNSNIISLLDRGFVFVIAHIRGGQEMGRQWYENGHLMNKKNTFYDFIDCGEYLVKEKYTSPHHLYANGASAGGLLMGAVINMRPDLWNGVIAQVPFVDVITTMSDSTIPLTTGEYREWGNPADSIEYFYMKSYSPYDNVTTKAYPNLLVTTGLHDSQVQYFEPAKWVAKLRSHKTDKNVLLFKTDMNAGHGGASGRFDSMEEDAVHYSFLLALEGIKK